eukprot:5497944-Amphidinium_carterae.1
MAATVTVDAGPITDSDALQSEELPPEATAFHVNLLHVLLGPKMLYSDKNTKFGDKCPMAASETQHLLNDREVLSLDFLRFSMQTPLHPSRVKGRRIAWSLTLGGTRASALAQCGSGDLPSELL